jgi:putative iron-only hydrogenase system regulator
MKIKIKGDVIMEKKYENVNDKKLAVIGIVITNREEAPVILNSVLSDYASIIVGRMGIPYNERGVSIISVIVDATMDEIGALSGKIGNIKGAKAKVAVTY